MPCRYAKVQTERTGVIGGSHVEQSVYCRLKMISEDKKHEVHMKLFELGLESSFPSTICPVAESDKWSICPYQKPE